MNINETQSKLQSIGLILMNQIAKSKFLEKMRYSFSPHKNKKFCKFLRNKLCIPKILKKLKLDSIATWRYAHS